MIGEVADGFTAILWGDHTAVAVATQQLSTNETHNHGRAVPVGTLELGASK